MIQILTGPDDYSIARAVDNIKAGIGDAAALEMATTALDGKTVTPDELKVVCETLPFMTDKRLVTVTGLLERFDGAGAKRKPRKTAKKSDKKDGPEEFAEAVSHLPESTVLLMIDGPVSGANPLLKALSGMAKVTTFPMMKEPQIRDWVAEKARARGGSVPLKVVTLLVRLIGADLRALENEMEKLILYAKGREVTEEDVRTLVTSTQEMNVFPMVDAVLEGKAELSGQLLQQQFRQGAAPPYLLTMLARQVRLIIMAGEMENRRVNRSEIQRITGLKNDFAFRKTLEQARRHPAERMKAVYEKLLDTDIAIKTGRLDPELALTLLVAEVAVTTRQTARR